MSSSGIDVMKVLLGQRLTRMFKNGISLGCSKSDNNNNAISCVRFRNYDAVVTA